MQSNSFDFQSMDNEDKNIIISYKGNIDETTFDSILQLTEDKLENTEFKLSIKKKIFNIVVEILQNMYHHFEGLKEENSDYYSVVFVLSKKGSDYKIVSGNTILKDQVEILKKKIDTINSLSSEDLKKLYRERLGNIEMDKNGGAGLGFLDIMRKSGKKLKYNFQKVNKDYSFFSLKVKISA